MSFIGFSFGLGATTGRAVLFFLVCYHLYVLNLNGQTTSTAFSHLFCQGYHSQFFSHCVVPNSIQYYNFIKCRYFGFGYTPFLLVKAWANALISAFCLPFDCSCRPRYFKYSLVPANNPLVLLLLTLLFPYNMTDVLFLYPTGKLLTLGLILF